MDQSKLNEIRETLAVLDYLMENIKKYAPEKYRSSEEFHRSVAGNIAVLTSLRQALEAKDHERLIKAIHQLKPAFSRLFIKFG